MKESWGIRVVLRKDKMKEGGKCPLHWEVTVNGQVSKFSTGKGIELKHWDNLKKEAKKGCGYSMVLNGYLRKTQTEFEEYMIGLENKGVPLTKKKVQTFFRGEKKVTFYEFFEKTIELWKSSKKESTINSYQNTLKIMREMDPDVDFADLTYEFLQNWDSYLINVRKNKVMGKFNRHKNLKTIIREAMLNGHMKENPYLHFKIKKEEGKREFLEIEEVKSLIEYELPIQHAKQQRTKDMFLFGCFTGLRFGDMVRLTWSNIVLNEDETKWVLSVEMQKTSKEVRIALMPPAVEILKRYSRHNLDEPIFDNITNQGINRNLKVLMKLVGIEKNITFHCSRHTFASNHVESDTSLNKLMKMLGHANITQTMIYAKTLQKDLDEAMSKLAKAYA